MENQVNGKKNNLIEVALFYGIILALARVSVDVILKLMDVSSGTYYLGYIIGFALEILIIVLAISYFKKKKNNGYLSFTEAIKIGLIMMIVTGIAFYLSSAFFDQDFQMRKAIEMTEQYAPEKLDETIEKLEEAKQNPKYLASFGLWLIYFIFLGFVISAPAGAIMKKDENSEY